MGTRTVRIGLTFDEEENRWYWVIGTLHSPYATASGSAPTAAEATQAALRAQHGGNPNLH